MVEIPRAGASAVAIIETPDSFITEGRPEIPGQLAHSGKAGLFGGHVEPDQTPYDAIRAELDQELDLRIIGPLQFIVSLFHVAIGATTKLNMKVGGSIVQIPKTLEGIEAYKESVTPFTFRALHRAVTDKLPS